MMADVINLMPVLLFLDISFGEIFIVVAVIFIIFGPQRIPEFARKFGKGMREIKKASSEIKREINKEVNQFKTDVDLERIVNEDHPPPKKKSEEEAKPDNKEADEDVKV
jgi:sec-independent protein translocase protein TatA